MMPITLVMLPTPPGLTHSFLSIHGRAYTDSFQIHISSPDLLPKHQISIISCLLAGSFYQETFYFCV